MYPRLAYKTATVPLTTTRLQQVDKEQRRMIASALRVKMEPGEELVRFCRRRNRHATFEIKKQGPWSKHLCKRAVKWHQHIERDSGGRLWSKKLLTLRDGSWLQLRRDMHATVAQRNRTNTRAIHGHVAQRWQDSVNLVEARANQT